MLQKAADIREKGTETMCTIQDIVYFFAILFVKHKIWRKRDAQISHGGKQLSFEWAADRRRQTISGYHFSAADRVQIRLHPAGQRVLSADRRRIQRRSAFVQYDNGRDCLRD